MTEVHLMPVRTFGEASNIQNRISGCVFDINGTDGSSIVQLPNGTYQVILFTDNLYDLAKRLLDEGFDL